MKIKSQKFIILSPKPQNPDGMVYLLFQFIYCSSVGFTSENAGVGTCLACRCVAPSYRWRQVASLRWWHWNSTSPGAWRDLSASLTSMAHRHLAPLWPTMVWHNRSCRLLYWIIPLMGRNWDRSSVYSGEYVVTAVVFLVEDFGSHERSHHSIIV